MRWVVEHQAMELKLYAERVARADEVKEATAASQPVSESTELRWQIHDLTEEIRRYTDQATAEVGRVNALDTAVRQLVGPLVERERLWYELGQIRGDPASRRDLMPLLEHIAGLGNFPAVLISNEQGLLVAANDGATDLENRAIMAARIISLADQLSGDGHAPAGVLVRDANNTTMICRLFQARGQMVALTVISNDPRLDATALDAVIPRIQMALAG